MKKKILTFLLMLCIVFLSACGSTSSGSIYQPEYIPPETQPPTIDRLPNLADNYNSHFLLKCRGYGACDTLTGNVMITMIMVEDDQSIWTEEALADYKQQQEAATQKLLQEAQNYGVDLNLTIRYETCRVSGTVSMDHYQDWVNAALSAANLPAQDDVIPYLKNLYGVKEAPVFFCANYSGRAFSIEWNQGDYFEYGVLYSISADYRHELNHLFGAADFYSPDVVEELSNKYLPNSIMSASEYQITDSLTAYLIGWTDTLSAEAAALLNETAWITQDYLDEQYRLETLTGYGTIRYGDGTYTGDLVSGVPNGQGSIVWDDGNTYEGQWKDGCADGHGIFRWNTDNCFYEGDWVAWQMHGYGTYTYPDGTVISGWWENGTFVGE